MSKKEKADIGAQILLNREVHEMLKRAFPDVSPTAIVNHLGRMAAHGEIDLKSLLPSAKQ